MKYFILAITMLFCVSLDAQVYFTNDGNIHYIFSPEKVVIQNPIQTTSFEVLEYNVTKTGARYVTEIIIYNVDLTSPNIASTVTMRPLHRDDYITMFFSEEHCIQKIRQVLYGDNSKRVATLSQ